MFYLKRLMILMEISEIIGLILVSIVLVALIVWLFIFGGRLFQVEQAERKARTKMYNQITIYLSAKNEMIRKKID